MYPLQYASWFPSDDKSLLHEGHSCSPDLDFQVPLASDDDQYELNYSPNFPNSGFAVSGLSKASNSCITITCGEIDATKLLRLNTPDSLF
jgi:hypothetical protein